MTIDLTEVIVAIIGLCGALVTGYVLPWLNAKLGTAKMEKLELYVKVAVEAAEQLLGAGRGEQKLAYVEEYLKEKGIKVDRTVIEAKVMELFGKTYLLDEAVG